MTYKIYECAKLSKEVYSLNEPEGWKLVPDTYLYDPSTDFAAAAYYRCNADGHPIDKDGYVLASGQKLDVVVVYRGKKSKTIEDWKTNLEIFADLRSSKERHQFDQAITFFEDISIKKIPAQLLDYELNYIITGHCLGGSLAQIVGSKNNLETYTFNGLGVKHLADDYMAGQNTESIYNYVIRGDMVGHMYDHIGNTKYIDDDSLSSLLGYAGT